VDNVVDGYHACVLEECMRVYTFLHGVTGILALCTSVRSNINVCALANSQHAAVHLVGNVVDFNNLEGIGYDFVLCLWGLLEGRVVREITSV
jgi:hypothetical protein